MRTTVTFDDAKLAYMMRVTRTKSPASAIAAGLDEWLRYRHKMDLLALRGSVDIDTTILELRELDTEPLQTTAPGIARPRRIRAARRKVKVA